MIKKIIAFDLDNTLCKTNLQIKNLNRYKNCKPIKKNILIVNELYNQGYYIKIYTARGINSCKGNIHKIYSSLYEQTKKDLKKWNLKYHELILGKQEYDLLVDDKAMNIDHCKSIESIQNFFHVR